MACTYFANGNHVCSSHKTKSKEHFEVQGKPPAINSIAYQCALYANGKPVKKRHTYKTIKNILQDKDAGLDFDVQCQQVGTCPVAPFIKGKDCPYSCQQLYSRSAWANGTLGNMCSCNLPGLRNCTKLPGYV